MYIDILSISRIKLISIFLLFDYSSLYKNIVCLRLCPDLFLFYVLYVFLIFLGMA